MTCPSCSKPIDPILDLVWSGRVLDLYHCDGCRDVTTLLRSRTADERVQRSNDPC